MRRIHTGLSPRLKTHVTVSVLKHVGGWGLPGVGGGSCCSGSTSPSRRQLLRDTATCSSHLALPMLGWPHCGLGACDAIRWQQRCGTANTDHWLIVKCIQLVLLMGIPMEHRHACIANGLLIGDHVIGRATALASTTPCATSTTMHLRWPDFAQAACAARLEEEDKLWEAIKWIPDLQCAWQVLVQCAGPRCLLRTLPPSHAVAYAQGHDEGM